MDLEARSMPPGMKASLLAKIREYRNDLNNLKSETKRLHSSNANVAARDELLEMGRADAMQVVSLLSQCSYISLQTSVRLEADWLSFGSKQVWMVDPKHYFSNIF